MNDGYGGSMTGEPHPLLQTLKQKHAEAHNKMCADNATPDDVLFYKGMWLAYNDAIGEIERGSAATSDKVLDELETWREHEEYSMGMFHKPDDYEKVWKAEWNKIKELRQQTKEREQR